LLSREVITLILFIMFWYMSLYPYFLLQLIYWGQLTKDTQYTCSLWH
jgi:hypothetical protein